MGFLTKLASTNPYDSLTKTKPYTFVMRVNQHAFPTRIIPYASVKKTIPYAILESLTPSHICVSGHSQTSYHKKLAIVSKAIPRTVIWPTVSKPISPYHN
jgi:hypothetical protein